MKIKYFATNESLSVFYSNKKELFEDLKDDYFGNENVVVYDIKDKNYYDDNLGNFDEELGPEDVFCVYKFDDKKIIMKDDLKEFHLDDLGGIYIL